MAARQLVLVAAFALALAMALVCPCGAEPIDGPPKIGIVAMPPPRDSLSHGARPAAIPDIYGPGAVLRGGNVFMKITNNGINGNPFFGLSSDPSAQWPGASGVEYLYQLGLAVGGVNPIATDPNSVRRVSALTEWYPPSAAPEDRIYRAYDGIVNGSRLVNDDGDFDLEGKPRIDEDFLDGRDNDGDGKIDEDYAAIGQTMYSCVMRDDTPAALANVGSEKHVPLGLECRQLAWCYSIPGFTDFNVIEYTVFNRSGHTLDSLYFGFPTDIDAGPLNKSAYWADDQDAPTFPSGEFVVDVEPDDPRYQKTVTTKGLKPLCAKRTIRVNGFSTVDKDGDIGRTPGVASLLLFGHTVDPLGVKAPPRVGFRSFRSYINGTPYNSNGAPRVDQQEFEFMSSGQNVDKATGLISAEAGDQSGDYGTWCSVGPFLRVPDGGSITATIGFAVHDGAYVDIAKYPQEYARYKRGLISLDDLFAEYPALSNAFNAQVAYDGVYELPRAGFEDQVPDCHGCETPIKLDKGSTPIFMSEQCPDRESVAKLVTDNAYTWFDFDCDVCTGVYDEFGRRGYYLRHWNAESPPPSPNVNVASSYNYSDHPGRIVAAGDRQVTLAWDNVSENTPDPKSSTFDFRSYRIWKVSGWKRPVGAAGPNDDDWALLAEFRLFDYADSNFTTLGVDCPVMWVPNYDYPAGDPHCASGSPGTPLAYGGCRDSATVSICLRRGDFWNRQSGQVLRPDTTVDCVRDTLGRCVVDHGHPLEDNEVFVDKTRYRVGRYRIVDREVQNGFLYFYSVTAGDSTDAGELFGRRAAVEADGVVPQVSVGGRKGVWVVPNPYRGYTNIASRPSSWDLTPNASDPTGTHVDFMGLPSGKWTIRIYTVSGDLVAELHSEDPVNDSIRSPVVDESGAIHPGFNRQEDNPNDGQARWNLISRNGQDVVSGIYVFVVDSSQGTQRGKFVVIR
jgi:hypothetical protein